MKYYKNITRLTLVSAILFSLSISCSEDYFDTDMGGRINPSDHYNTFEDAIASYEGCFAYLQDIADKMILVDGLRSDLTTVTSNAPREMIDINIHEYATSNSYIDPSPFYKMIVNINEVIPNLPQIVEKDRDFDSTMLELLTGNLVSLRSWAYLTLAKLNGEVALVDGSLSSVDPGKPLTYLTKLELVDYLINELLPYVDEDDVYRYVVDHYVLLGELYLEKRNYAEASKWLKFACDGVARGYDYMVTDDYEEEGWWNLFLNSAYAEADIFTAVPYSFEHGQKNMLEQWMNRNYEVKPTNKLANLYASQKNGDGGLGDLYRGAGVTYDSIFLPPDNSYGGLLIRKYNLELSLPFSSDIILYRSADITLLLAEAQNCMGNYSNALALLNDGFGNLSTAARPEDFKRWRNNEGVRGRVVLKPRIGADELTIENLIMEERAMELAFEGKRWFDLVRVAERRNDPAYLANAIASKFEGAEAENMRSKLMNPTNWYLPLSRVE